MIMQSFHRFCEGYISVIVVDTVVVVSVLHQYIEVETKWPFTDDILKIILLNGNQISI